MNTYTHVGYEDAQKEMERVHEAWKMAISKNKVNLLRFLLILRSKLCQLMPRYAKKGENLLY